MDKPDSVTRSAAGAGDRYSCIHFDDHSSFADLINERFGLHWHSMQLSAGRGPICYAQFEAPSCGLSITHSHLVQNDFSEFEVPAGYTLFSVCHSKSPHYQNGYLVDLCSMIVYQGGRSYQAAYAGGWESFDILVNNELAYREPRLGAELQKLHPDADVIASPYCGKELGKLVDKLVSLYTLADRCESEQQRDIIAEAAEIVLNRLPGVLQEEFPGNASYLYPRSRRPEVVRRATQYLSEIRDKQVTAEDLARGLGVSYRLLNYAFKDAIGVTPYQYILIDRLHQARRELKCTDAAIEELIENHGFDTPSRFRTQYRRLFGELPGETRQRTLCQRGAVASF